MSKENIAIVCLSIVVIAALVNLVYADSNFTMTERINKESRLLAVCIQFNIQNKSCDDIYGGTGNYTYLTPENYTNGSGY